MEDGNRPTKETSINSYDKYRPKWNTDNIVTRYNKNKVNFKNLRSTKGSASMKVSGSPRMRIEMVRRCRGIPWSLIELLAI